MTDVLSIFRIIFCAVPAFIRVEPAITSGPTYDTDRDMSASFANRRIRTLLDDGDRLRAQRIGVLQAANNVRRAPAGGNATDDIRPRQSARFQVFPRALWTVFHALNRLRQGIRSAGDEALHQIGRDAECRHAFDRVENAQPAAGAGAQVEESSTIGDRLCNDVDRIRDLRQRLSYSGSNLGVFAVDQA